ncbi:MAG: helix-turn-helix transcriptional regulator [Proteobacteria bacterium]|nr:helix-turn-helix transcriptional regulator [Pseudomonadota bacterium]
MPPTSKGRRSACPLDYALDVFGDRWTLLVVRDLLFFQRVRFAELLQAGEGIATNILADRLRKLEAKGVVNRRPDPNNGRQVLYSLTDKGLALAPLMVEIIRWSARFDPETAVPKELQERLGHDREGYLRELLAQAKDEPTT